MNPIAIQVTLRVHAGKGEAFVPPILANAEGARRDEPDCHDFQVFRAEDDPDVFVLFEVYTDAAALDVHRETPHYRAFQEAAGDLIAGKEVRRLEALGPGGER
jgi:quinol monooxygenase YgiN